MRTGRIDCLDPGGVLWTGIGPRPGDRLRRLSAAEVIEPGVVRHVEGDRFSLGEPSGERTERVQALSRALISAASRRRYARKSATRCG